MTQSLGTPRAYVRMLCELEDFLNKTLAGARWRAGIACFPPGQLGPSVRPLVVMLPACREAQAEPHQHACAHAHEANAAQAQRGIRRADAAVQVGEGAAVISYHLSALAGKALQALQGMHSPTA